MLEIVDTNADASPGYLIFDGKAAPSLVDFQDRAGFIQYGNVTRQSVERRAQKALRFPQGFFYPLALCDVLHSAVNATDRPVRG